MYICIYVYMYICIYVYMYICIYVYMYICIFFSLFFFLFFLFLFFEDITAPRQRRLAKRVTSGKGLKQKSEFFASHKKHK